jgi:hypothetical protein
MSSSEDSGELKTALGEVKGVVTEVKEGILDAVDEGREVAAAVRVKPIRRAVRRRLFRSGS